MIRSAKPVAAIEAISGRCNRLRRRPGTKKRQRGQRKDEHGDQTGGDERGASSLRDQAEVHPDLGGDDDETERRCLQETRRGDLAAVEQRAVHQGRDRARGEQQHDEDRHQGECRRLGEECAPVEFESAGHEEEGNEDSESCFTELRAEVRVGHRLVAVDELEDGTGHEGAEDRIERSAPTTASPTAAASATKAPSKLSFAPSPDEWPEKKSERRTIVATSAIEAPASTTCPNCVVDSPASLSTGMTTPSEVAAAMIPIRSGDFTRPASCRPSAKTSAIPSEAANPTPVSFSRRPRNCSNSTSRPASRSRNARPSRLITCTGSSTFAQPRTEGPSAMPSTISSTTAGSRNAGTRPSARGAAKAAAATIRRFVNPALASSGSVKIAVGRTE